MMTTNLFAIANVKQLWTYEVLEFYCLFFRTSWCVGVLNSAIFFNSFHNQVEFRTIFWRVFGISVGGLNTRKPPPGYATSQCFFLDIFWSCALWICSTRMYCIPPSLHWHVTASVGNVWWKQAESRILESDFFTVTMLALFLLSSLSLGPVANATDVLQPGGLLYNPIPPSG